MISNAEISWRQRKNSEQINMKKFINLKMNLYFAKKMPIPFTKYHKNMTLCRDYWAIFAVEFIASLNLYPRIWTVLYFLSTFLLHSISTTDVILFPQSHQIYGIEWRPLKPTMGWLFLVQGFKALSSYISWSALLDGTVSLTDSGLHYRLCSYQQWQCLTIFQIRSLAVCG